MIKSFKDSYWYPKPSPDKAVSVERVPGEMLKASLVENKASVDLSGINTQVMVPPNGLDIRIFLVYEERITVKTTWSLEKFPFDKQVRCWREWQACCAALLIPPSQTLQIKFKSDVKEYIPCATALSLIADMLSHGKSLQVGFTPRILKMHS